MILLFSRHGIEPYVMREVRGLNNPFPAVRWVKLKDDRHHRSRLVIVMHDFEQLEPQVVQDMFEICRSDSSCWYLSSYQILLSLHIPCLPLVFILALASPPSPSYIRATYPHSMLALLRVRDCPFPLAEKSLHDILLEVDQNLMSPWRH